MSLLRVASPKPRSLEMAIHSQEHEYLKPKQAATFLQCSVRTLARWRAEGTGPRYHKHRGRILYAIAVLRSWLDETEVVPVRGGS